MVGHGGSSAGSYLANPTSPIPSHCASIVATSTVRVKLYSLFDSSTGSSWRLRSSRRSRKWWFKAFHTKRASSCWHPQYQWSSATIVWSHRVRRWYRGNGQYGCWCALDQRGRGWGYSTMMGVTRGQCASWVMEGWERVSKQEQNAKQASREIMLEIILRHLLTDQLVKPIMFEKGKHSDVLASAYRWTTDCVIKFWMLWS